MTFLALFMMETNKSCNLGIFVGNFFLYLIKIYKIKKDIRYLCIVLIKKNYDPPFFTDQMKVVTEIKYITFLLLAV